MAAVVGVHPSLYVPAPVNAAVVDVRDYGVIGSGLVDDQPELQAACTALPDNGVLFIPPGFVCGISAPVLCQNKFNIRIVAHGARLKTLAGSVWTPQQAMLKLDGTRHSYSNGLRVTSDLLTNMPGAGVVFGRTSPVVPGGDGTHWRVDDLFVDGHFAIASVYNCGSEVFRVFGGLWYSSRAGVPAYYDTDDDSQNGLANGTGNNSNKHKHFYGTQMANQAAGDVETVVVVLSGYQYEVSFRDAYWHSSGNLACRFLWLKDEDGLSLGEAGTPIADPNGTTALLTIDGIDFEQNNGTSPQHAGTRAIYCQKTVGLSELRLEDIKFNPAGAEYLMEVDRSSISAGRIWYVQGAGAKLVKATSTGQFRTNTLDGQITAGSIEVNGAGASATENIIMNHLAGHPLAATGGANEFQTGDAVGHQDNLIMSVAAFDALISGVVSRSRMGVFGSGDTTPTVQGLRIFETANAVPTSYSRFDDGEPGQTFILFVKDANSTFVHTAANTADTIKVPGGVTWVAPNGAMLMFQRDERRNGIYQMSILSLPTLETDIGALTDNSGGTVDNTIAAIPNPGDAPADADALREDLVANVLPPLRNDLADLTEQINALRTALRNRGIMA